LSFPDEKGFNAKISQCIGRALDSLGEGIKQSLYYQIQQKYNLPREQITFKPREVIKHLEQILGATGSLFVEKLIIREIRNSFELEFECNIPLTTVIIEARKKFLNVSEAES
jgi:hypothetical protein